MTRREHDDVISARGGGACGVKIVVELALRIACCQDEPEVLTTSGRRLLSSANMKWKNVTLMVGVSGGACGCVPVVKGTSRRSF